MTYSVWIKVKLGKVYGVGSDDDMHFCSLQDFHDVHAFQAFSRYDVNKAGHVTALQFHDIMISLKRHLLTNFVRENLVSVRLLNILHLSHNLLKQ